MTNQAAYNYDAFSFELEAPEFARWQETAPRPGELAPDFELPDAQGRMVRLSALRGHPVVLEFGSYTCPIFCGHVPVMEQLARRHREAAFLVVYTREAHPGELIEAHADGTEKAHAAQLLVRDEKIARTLVIDDLAGSVHRLYGGAWDTVFLIAADGRVLIRRAWNDPAEIAAALLALRGGDEVPPSESLEMAPPSGGPFGEGLLRGGARALRDFYDSAPPPVRTRLESSESIAVRELLASPPSPLTRSR